MAGPPDRTAAAGRPAALLMRVLGARLRYQATRKGGTNKISDLQQHELFTAQAKEALDEAADRMNWHQVGTFPVFGASIWSASSPNGTSPPPSARARTRRRPGVGPDYPGSGGSRARQRTRRGSDGLAPRRFLHRPVGRPAAVRPNWPSATQLVPDLQRPLAVGDGILDGPPGAAWFRGGAGPPAAAAGVALQQPRARRLAGATGRLDRLLVDVDVRVADTARAAPACCGSWARTGPWWLSVAYLAALVPADDVLADSMLAGVRRRADRHDDAGRPGRWWRRHRRQHRPDRRVTALTCCDGC
jgi:hypothetical protein